MNDYTEILTDIYGQIVVLENNQEAEIARLEDVITNQQTLISGDNKIIEVQSSELNIMIGIELGVMLGIILAYIIRSMK